MVSHLGALFRWNIGHLFDKILLSDNHCWQLDRSLDCKNRSFDSSIDLIQEKCLMEDTSILPL